MPKPLPTTNKRNDGYVGILFFTALLMGVGILLMYVENDEYDFNNTVNAAPPQKLSASKAKAPASADVTPAPAPVPTPPEARVLPAPAIVLPVSPAPVVATAPIVPIATTPTASIVDASAPSVKPEAQPAVEPEPPAIRPGFTLPRPPRR